MTAPRLRDIDDGDEENLILRAGRETGNTSLETTKDAPLSHSTYSGPLPALPVIGRS
jgi:hypothetical protein